MSAVLDLEKGIAAFKLLVQETPERAERAAAFGINDTTLYARRQVAKRIRGELNFKLSYLNGDTSGGKRLSVTKKAKPGDLEGVVLGRDRPTSLARFKTGPSRFGRPRVAPRVRVRATGGNRALKRGFYVKLRAGKAASSDNFNEGLAIRVSPGEQVRNKMAGAVPFGKNTFLLYGPSVGQAARSHMQKLVGDVGTELQDNFARHYERLTR